MKRELFGGRMVIATHNPGKLREIAELLAPFSLETVSAAALGLPEPPETGSTFTANAELKALAAAIGSGLPALADDSGLAVEALGGEPGIYSARWAGPEKDFSLAMRRVEDALEARRASGPAQANGAGREAAFVCALALAWPDGEVEVFEGRVEGALVWPPRGARGFGYDPMFVPSGDSRTFGEMPPEEKHAISHRARAFAQLVSRLEQT